MTVWYQTGAADDERENAEDEVRREKHNEAASRCKSDGIIDGPQELAQRKVEKGDGEMEEGRDASRPSSASETWSGPGRGTRCESGVKPQVLASPLLNQREHERTRQAEEEAEEYEDVDAACRWLGQWATN